MKWTTGRLVLSFLVILGGVIGFEASGQNINEALPPYKEIKIFNGLEVTIVPSDSDRIEISGHSKEKVTFEIVDNRVELRTELDNIWSDDNTHVTIYGKTIEIIDANEGSSVEVEGVLEQSNLVLRAQEGSSIYAKIDAEKAYSKAVSGGSITVVGKVEVQDVEVNTGGNFFGQDLVSKKTEIQVGTAGRGEVYASKYCKATATLGGVIEVTGNPERFDHKTSLGGKIL